jgi:hypothetical protein
VTEVLERPRRLATLPVDARDDAAAAVRAVCADPGMVNGAQLPITALVERVRSLQRAFNRLDMHIPDTVQTPDRIVIAFCCAGGTRPSPASQPHQVTRQARSSPAKLSCTCLARGHAGSWCRPW